MDDIARLGSVGRAELFTETAARLGIARAVIVEKDFWVCWTLHRLFALQAARPEEHPGLVFKGGTSLSKAFRLIERFSEDIDLTLDWRGLGFTGERDPADAASRRRRDTLLGELASACEQYIASTLLPALRSDFATVLGADEGEWSLTVDVDEAQTLNFRYPPSLTGAAYTDYGYLRPTVRLEFGARGEQWPSGLHTVTPYAAEIFPEQFRTPSATVRALEAERTFWEKATILHAWAHRGALPSGGERASRHYYDIAMLARSSVRTRALQAIELLTDVAEHKQRFYPAAWASYETARPGTLRLLPDEPVVRALGADYGRMAEMIFGEIPVLERLLDDLRDLEQEINSRAPGAR